MDTKKPSGGPPAAGAHDDADFTAEDVAYASAAEKEIEDDGLATLVPSSPAALNVGGAVNVPNLLTDDQYQDLKQSMLVPAGTSRTGSGSAIHGSDDDLPETPARRSLTAGYGAAGSGAGGHTRGIGGHHGRSIQSITETIIAATMTPHGHNGHNAHTDAEAKYQKLYAEYKKLQANFEEKVTENKGLTAELEQAKLVVGAFFTQNALLGKKIADIRGSYATMAKDNKKMAVAYDELKLDYAKLHKVYAKVLDENKKLTALVKGLENTCREQDARIKTLMRNAMKTAKRVADLEAQHKEFQVQKAELQASVAAARADGQELLVGEVGLQFERAVVHHVFKDNNRTDVDRADTIASIIKQAQASAAGDAKADQLTKDELARWQPIAEKVTAVWGSLNKFCIALRAVKRVRLRKAHILDGRDALSVDDLRGVDHVVSAKLGEGFVKGYHVLIDILAKLIPNKPMQSLIK